MNFFLFLTLLCLGIASAAPKVDHSLDATSNQWNTTPGAVVDAIIDTINNADVEESPEVLEEDGQEQSKEPQSFRTATKASGDISLRIKLPKGLFDKVKYVVGKAKLGKVAKRFGKYVLGKMKNPKNVAKVIKTIGKHVLKKIRKQDSLSAAKDAPGNVTNEEFQAEDELVTEPETENEERTTTEIPTSVDSTTTAV